MKFNQIIQGDIRTVARELPDQSVNCIVTSPPYFGLRDYQTAEWVGGIEGCDHIQVKKIHPSASDSKSTLGISSGGGKRRLTENNSGNIARDKQYKSVCKKCGAQRKDAQMGLEESPEAYVNELVGVFRELRRVLRDDGSLWLNLGDSFSDKQLQGIPWRVALALQADGWWLRNDCVWSKKSPMPESVTDRFTKAHEYVFVLSKSPRYYFDQEAVREPHKDKSLARYEYGLQSSAPKDNFIAAGSDTGTFKCKRMGDHMNPSGRNKRTVWKVEDEAQNKLREILTYLAAEHPETLVDIERNLSLKSDVFEVSTLPYKGAHFACFPPKLIEPCILAGCPSRVCAECGEPWRREVEKGKVLSTGGSASGARAQSLQTVSPLGQTVNEAYNTGKFVAREHITLGFSPQCQCNAPHQPGVILDPFFGSGTVAQVAIETGRDWLGVELNPDYIELAERRIAGTQPALFAPDEAMNGNAKAKQLTLTLDEE